MSFMAFKESAPSLREATERWRSAPAPLRFEQRHALRSLADEFNRLHERIEALVNSLAGRNSRVNSLLGSGRPFGHQSELARGRARSGESDLAQSLIHFALASEPYDEAGLTDQLWHAVHRIRDRIRYRADQPDLNVHHDLALLREASCEFAGARDNLTAAVATFGGDRSADRPRRGIRMRA
jgi:hypothetical protein